MRIKKIKSFAPVSKRKSKILILGSIPGETSIRTGEYYAHARNSFWPIMASILNFNIATPYQKKKEALKKSGIALWDVLHFCRRKGSADNNIDPGSEQVNDFKNFFRMHKNITYIFFNGSKAESCFIKHRIKQIAPRNVIYCRLPSTSPANAKMNFETKLKIWRSMILRAIDDEKINTIGNKNNSQ